MSYTLILRHDGIDRHFHVVHRSDADVLFDALARRYSHVEMWEGKNLICRYSAEFV